MASRELILRAQAGKSHDPRWYRVHRRLSIHLTLWLLPTAVTPVQVTLAMMVTWLVGAALIATPSGALNVWGFVLLYLAFLLDKVDGELARLRCAESARGVLLDRLHHRLVEPTLFLAAAWHDFARRGDVSVLAAGFGTALLANIIEEQQHLPPYIFFKRLGEGWRPSESVPAAPPAWRRARALMRPLKVFRMPITALGLLAACRLGEALVDVPLISHELVIGTVALAIYTLFQCVDAYHYRLHEDFVEIAVRHGWSDATVPAERPVRIRRARLDHRDEVITPAEAGQEERA